MNDTVKELLEKYRDETAKMLIPAKRVEDQVGMAGVRGLQDEQKQIGHAQWMIYTMLEEASGWTELKTNRWLGFIQGIFWTTKLRGIEELRDESRDLYQD